MIPGHSTEAMWVTVVQTSLLENLWRALAFTVLVLFTISSFSLNPLKINNISGWQETSLYWGHPIFFKVYGKKMRVSKRKAILAAVVVPDRCWQNLGRENETGEACLAAVVATCSKVLLRVVLFSCQGTGWRHLPVHCRCLGWHG